MARLLAFLAGEKVILDNQGNVSVINILQEVKIAFPPQSAPTVGTLIPLQWSLLSLWFREEADREPFDVMYEFRDTTDSMIFKSEPMHIDFEGFSKRAQRVISGINLFPAWVEGWLTVVLFTKRRRDDDFVEQSRLPIFVIHETTSGAQVAPG